MSSGSSCLNVRVSTIVGCFGIAPISSSLRIVNACFAPFFADGAGAELAGDGAAEVSELVWLWDEDPVLLGDGVSDGVSAVVVGTVTTGTFTVTLGMTGTVVADTGEAGFTGLIGLTGESTFVGLVTDFTQVSDDVTHEPHTGCPYGFGHVLVIVCVMLPVYPAWHDRVWLCVLTWQVGGFHRQVSCVSVHCPQTGWP
jgi:hypothetical protein